LKVRRGYVEALRFEEAARLLPRDNSALIEYVVTEEKTFLFVLSRERSSTSRVGTTQQPEALLSVYTIAIKQKDLSQRAETFRRQLARRDFRFGKTGSDLYSLLLAPARAQLAGKSLLVIVPDAGLWQLPFQALQPAENRFLLEDSAICYAPSLTVLREMLRLESHNGPDSLAKSSLLAIGNPALGKQTLERLKTANRDERLEPLPEAEREVRALAQLYGNRRSEVFIGPEAREDRLKAEAGKFGILHLATHGVLDNSNPMYSHLVLSQAEGDTNEDGLLEVWEMMNLDLKADLVVLSACETARGRIAEGEGVIGMSWALFVAGCPTAVVSQWKVDSASTTELMLEFHRDLTRTTPGKRLRVSAAESLREAALKLMHTPEYRHPFYWAGFVVVGAGF
jgi:CHAT domain-containing protein